MSDKTCKNKNEKSQCEDAKVENTGCCKSQCEDNKEAEHKCCKSEQIAKLSDEVLRGYAEIENIKKRAFNDIRLRGESVKSSFANSIIPVLDGLNRTISSFEEGHKDKEISVELKGLFDGLKLVQTSFLSSLSEQGITPIKSIGEKFDPAQHSAIQQLENTGEESGTIISEVQAGYKLTNKIIKESMVVVAK